jgi:RNA polymerase sigma factor (TIGR02999 family)
MTDRPITELLQDLRNGDPEALDRVFSELYDELQFLARRQRQRWDGNQTLNTTALVHEAYLKLVGQSALSLRSRGHFFALASRAVRHILCNYRRDQEAQKRGGGQKAVPLEDAGEAVAIGGPGAPGADRILALDEALTRLEAAHPRPARVVECRFFGGLTVEETAAALEISVRTVKRDWAFAQAWLHGELEGGDE